MVSATSIDRFIRGAGTYTGDLRVPGMLHGCFLRSPHAHADIVAIEIGAAAAMPGVRLILTGRDPLVAACRPMPTTPLKGIDGRPIAAPAWRILADDRVRHVGQVVALVVADTEAQALEASDAIMVTYAPLPSVTDLAGAMANDAPLLCPDAPGNIALRWSIGESDAVIRAFDRAARIVRVTVPSQRVMPATLEPRAALALWDEATSSLCLHTPSQGAAMLRLGLAGILGLTPEELRVVTPDVGGAFGAKTAPYPEQAVLLLAAQTLRRPVRWIATRAEAFLSDSQGRGSVMEGAMAFDSQGQILALDVKATQALGAYLTPHGAFTATGNFAACLSGCYAIPALHAEVACVLTNLPPLAPYRGAGRPEANYLLERLMERAAQELGEDPVELRRRNLVSRAEIPYRTPHGQTYDSGDFPRLLAEAEALADKAGFAKRRQDSAIRGRLRGFGLGLYLEVSGGLPFESAGLRFLSDDRVDLLAGGQASGQNHDVSLVRVLSRVLGVTPDCIGFVQGDSNRLPGAGPSVGSRTLVSSGLAIVEAARQAIAKGLPVAAELLQADPGQIGFGDGVFRIAETGRTVSLWSVAERARALDPGDGSVALDVTVKVTVAPTYPNGCHFAEVEIDPRTGTVAVIRYGALDDAGDVVNPETVAGQVVGGVAQGLGQALMEEALYDPATGQLLTGSFMDYPLPRADDMPDILPHEFHGAPCATNPLGAKGAGEGGTTGALAPIMIAINDALAQAGAPPVEMPATPPKVWAALRMAKLRA
jgi:carbon-monoxide dehydrogenase large subunit